MIGFQTVFSGEIIKTAGIDYEPTRGRLGHRNNPTKPNFPGKNCCQIGVDFEMKWTTNPWKSHD